MKNKMYTIAVIFMLVSCKSVEKMVEKGEYDKAFNYSISKLEGEKNKKTKYVKALEKAFVKLNVASQKEIDKLSPDRKPENWPKVLNLYKIMEDRQNRLDPILPLVSEDGYEATFDIVNYNDEIRMGEDKTCLYYYTNAQNLLTKSEKTKDKLFARDAYDELKKLEMFRSEYKDSERLKERALNLGLTRVGIDIFSDLRNFQGYAVERDMWNLPVSIMDNLWHDYTMKKEDEDLKEVDYVFLVELNYIDFSPERERVNNYSEEKEILIKTEKVKEKRDSAVVYVEKEVFEKVRAQVSEIFREKKAELRGVLKVFDNRTKEIIKSIPINVFQDFNGYACRYTGDERALTPESKKKMDSFCELFPSDEMMAGDLSSAFKRVVMNEARKISIN